jgi:hypothetical protein
MYRIQCFLIVLVLFRVDQLSAQPRQEPLTRADTLRGMYSPERACYDLSYYHLDVRIDPATQSLQGSNEIYFTAVSDFTTMQIDLFKNLEIEKIVLDNGPIAPFTRELNTVYVNLPARVEKGSKHHITVFYGGKPTVAAFPPWQGGFTWAKDSSGNP